MPTKTEMTTACSVNENYNEIKNTPNYNLNKTNNYHSIINNNNNNNNVQGALVGPRDITA